MKFSTRLLKWYDKNGRQDLPWRHSLSPYRVWLSEIMLQQTQVKTVIPYFENFLKRFPNVITLANAKLDEVLHLWSGLGYYSRARNLHKTAVMIRDQYHGIFPATLNELQALPGVGRSTAGAILSIAFNQAAPILDGNVKRVLSRQLALRSWPDQTKNLGRLWQYAETLLPQKNYAEYTQAIMDLGATVCTRTKPKCMQCPVMIDCKAFKLKLTQKIPAAKPKKNLTSKINHHVDRNKSPKKNFIRATSC